MENVDKKEGGDCCHGENCKSGCCGGMMNKMHGCWGGKCCLLKVVLKLVILMLVFWFGFKLGEITGFVKSGREFGGENRYGFGMMGGKGIYFGNTQSGAVLPVTTTPETPVK